MTQTQPAPTLATDQAHQVPDFVTKLLTQSTQAYHALQPALGKRAALVEELDEIEHDGWTRGSEYWRDGDKLVLVHPTDRETGDRYREYIGKEPAKIAEARARVARGVRRDAIQSELQELDRRLRQAQEALEQFSQALSGKSRWG
jgi:hypothetical protein